MRTNLLMDFVVNKETSTITVKREFAAQLPNVWDAFTKSEILDLWWAPKPWVAKTKTMNFKENGHWHYVMVGPAGEEHWCLANYITIQTQKSFTALEGFSDAEGNLNTHMPQSKWLTDFNEIEKGSMVVFNITYNSLSQLETVLQMGFKEGFTLALEGLDEIFDSNNHE